jgi:hypothetical protein
LISLLVIPIASASLLRFVWKLTSQKVTKVVIIGFLALFSLGAASKMSSIADQFSRRVNDGGAIRNTSIVGVVVVFLAALALSGIVHGRARYILISTSAVTGSALVTVQLIAWARNDLTDAYGYYGQKLLYTANCVSWFLLVALLGLFLTYLSRPSGTASDQVENHKKYFWVKSLGVVFFFALLSLPVAFLSNAKSPAISIYNGWDSPSEKVVSRTLHNWSSGNQKYVFASYGTDSNDRMGNFWSPYFWEPNRWEWTYSGYGVDARSLCSVISGNEITLITDSQDLMRQMGGMCSVTLDQVTVEN